MAYPNACDVRIDFYWYWTICFPFFGPSPVSTACSTIRGTTAVTHDDVFNEMSEWRGAILGRFYSDVGAVEMCTVVINEGWR